MGKRCIVGSEKNCAYCAEIIKWEAIVCKHCGSKQPIIADNDTKWESIRVSQLYFAPQRKYETFLAEIDGINRSNFVNGGPQVSVVESRSVLMQDANDLLEGQWIIFQFAKTDDRGRLIDKETKIEGLSLNTPYRMTEVDIIFFLKNLAVLCDENRKTGGAIYDITGISRYKEPNLLNPDRDMESWATFQLMVDTEKTQSASMNKKGTVALASEQAAKATGCGCLVLTVLLGFAFPPLWLLSIVAVLMLIASNANMRGR